MKNRYNLLILLYIGFFTNSLNAYPTYLTYEWGTLIPSFIWSETSILFYDSSDPEYESYFYTPEIGWLYSDINNSDWNRIKVNESKIDSDEFLAASSSSSGAWAFSWKHGWMYFNDSRWVTYRYGKSYYEDDYTIQGLEINYNTSHVFIYMFDTDDWILTSEVYAPWAWSYKLNEWIQL